MKCHVMSGSARRDILAQCNSQGGNNVKAGLGVCVALSRNYVSSCRGTAIMRKKMHSTVFRYRRGNSPE